MNDTTRIKKQNGTDAGIVHISNNAVHLGHNITTSDRDSTILAAKRAFWKTYDIFLYLILVICIHYVRIAFLHHFVAVFMGHLCGCKIAQEYVHLFIVWIGGSH